MSAKGELDLVVEWLNEDEKRELREYAEAMIVARQRRRGSQLSDAMKRALLQEERDARESEVATKQWSLR